MVRFLGPQIGIIQRGSQEMSCNFQEDIPVWVKPTEWREGSKHPDVTLKPPFSLLWKCPIGHTQVEARGLGGSLMCTHRECPGHSGTEKGWGAELEEYSAWWLLAKIVRSGKWVFVPCDCFSYQPAALGGPRDPRGHHHKDAGYHRREESTPIRGTCGLFLIEK